MKKYVMFDLDGTIIDSSEGILNGFMYVMEHYNVKNCRREDFSQYIGPPLLDTFAQLLGESEAEAATAKYREYYGSRGKFECRMYDGIPQLMRRLYDAGCTLILATSKHAPVAVSMMENLGLAPMFSVISGNDVNRGDKTSVMRYALEQAGVDDLSKAVMVGDRKYDIESAGELGVESIGVLYGFGDRQELEAYGADHIVASAAEVGDVILSL